MLSSWDWVEQGRVHPQTPSCWLETQTWNQSNSFNLSQALFQSQLSAPSKCWRSPLGCLSMWSTLQTSCTMKWRTARDRWKSARGSVSQGSAWCSSWCSWGGWQTARKVYCRSWRTCLAGESGSAPSFCSHTKRTWQEVWETTLRTMSTSEPLWQTADGDSTRFPTNPRTAGKSRRFSKWSKHILLFFQSSGNTTAACLSQSTSIVSWGRWSASNTAPTQLFWCVSVYYVHYRGIYPS